MFHSHYAFCLGRNKLKKEEENVRYCGTKPRNESIHAEKSVAFTWAWTYIQEVTAKYTTIFPLSRTQFWLFSGAHGNKSLDSTLSVCAYWCYLTRQNTKWKRNIIIQQDFIFLCLEEFTLVYFLDCYSFANRIFLGERKEKYATD